MRAGGVAMAGLGVLGFVLLWVGAVWVCSDQARVKGRRHQHWVVAGVLTGWIAALLVLCLPEKCAAPRACPQCFGVIPGAARRCRHCGSEV